MRSLLVALSKLIPLVGEVTGKFENRGIFAPLLRNDHRSDDVLRIQTADRRVGAPRSRHPLRPGRRPIQSPTGTDVAAKLRVAATTRASISTS